MIRLLFCYLLIGQTLAQTVAPAPAKPTSQRGRDDMRERASDFLQTLSAEQRAKATYPFDDAERFTWYFVPHERNGLSMKNMTDEQRKLVHALLKTGLSEQGYQKAISVMDNENVLRVIDNRPPNDTYRDPDNYFVTIFGNPNGNAPWSWRVEGHHLALQFMAPTQLSGGRALAQTPTFFGSNPGVLNYDSTMADKRMSDPRVAGLPQKGRQILKQETDRAFALLNALDPDRRKQAVLDPVAYPDIVTGNRRSALLEKMDGLRMADMTADQRKLFMELLQTYLTNYRITLANQQMAKLEKAGLDNLRFAWAGDLTPKLGDGKGWYYRIHGPTILIEYDNTQNNANHVHAVVRDLTNDFGEDLLKEHYRTSTHAKP